MAEALSRHANEAFDELTPREQEICASMFRALTIKGADGRGVRRPTRMDLIAQIAEASPEEVIAVVERFRMHGRTFLMPPPSVPLDASSVIDISHESLMRVWVRCKTWVDEEFEAVKMYMRLAEASKFYVNAQAGLWVPPDLDLATEWYKKVKPNVQWAARYDGAFERAIEFYDRSKKEYESSQRKKEKKQKVALRRSKAMAAIFGMAAVGAIMLVFFAQMKASEAEREAIAADMARREAVESERKAKDSEILAQRQKAIADQKAVEAEEAPKEIEAPIEIGEAPARRRRG
jgi:hypothetical protein